MILGQRRNPPPSSRFCAEPERPQRGFAPPGLRFSGSRISGAGRGRTALGGGQERSRRYSISFDLQWNDVLGLPHAEP